MSLFVDVFGVLSDKIKAHFVEIIEKERDGQERSVRKVCDVCSNYLVHGELRYDKVEDGISQLEKMPSVDNPFYVMLFAILNEMLDEDLNAMKFFTGFSKSSLARPFQTEIDDFIAVGRFATFNDFQELENAASILIDRYTNENNIAETLTNLYFKAESEEYLPLFQRLLAKAKEKYPSGIQLESFNGFICMTGQHYEQALESFMTVRERLEVKTDNKFFNFNLATVWDSIADCYLKMGNAAKTIESCDTALSYDANAEDYMVGNSILYKKAEALLLAGEKDQALDIVKRILDEDEDDEKALSIREKINSLPPPSL